MDRQKLIDHHWEVRLTIVFHFKRLSSTACPGGSQFFGTIHTLKECVRNRQHKPKNKYSFLPSPTPLLYSGLVFLLLFYFICFSLIHFVPVLLPTHMYFKKKKNSLFHFSINEGAKEAFCHLKCNAALQSCQEEKFLQETWNHVQANSSLSDGIAESISYLFSGLKTSLYRNLIWLSLV